MGSGNNLLKGVWESGLLKFKTLSNTEVIRFNTSGIYIPSGGTLEVDGTLQFDAGLTMNEDITFDSGYGIRTGSTNADTMTIDVYDTDGAAYTTWMTFTVASSPTATLNQDLTVANGKAIQPSTTTGQSLVLKIYDVDAAAYVSGITFTNASAPVVAIAQTVEMTAGKGIEFRTSGESIISSATGKITISGGGAGADDITLSGAVTCNDDMTFGTGKGLQSGTTSSNTLTLAAYDVDGAAYSDMITLTSASAPGVTMRINDGITLNNNGSSGSVGVFIISSSGSVISNSDTGAVGTAEGYIAVNLENAIRYIYLFDNKPSA